MENRTQTQTKTYMSRLVELIKRHGYDIDMRDIRRFMETIVRLMLDDHTVVLPITEISLRSGIGHEATELLITLIQKILDEEESRLRMIRLDEDRIAIWVRTLDYTNGVVYHDEKIVYNYALLASWLAEMFLLPGWNYTIWYDDEGLPELMNLSLHHVPYVIRRYKLCDLNNNRCVWLYA